MSDELADLALGDELSAALAVLAARRDATLPDLAEPRSELTFELACGNSHVVLRPGQSVVIGRAVPGRAALAGFLGVEHPMVSRRHVVLRHGGGELIADDLGSRNGTILERGATLARLAGPTVLVDADRLRTVEGVELCHVVERPAGGAGPRR
jgi:hypothetical protein